MSFELVRGESSAPERKLSYTPKLDSFEDGKMTIKFDFDHPLYVSTGDTPDRIVAKFIRSFEYWLLFLFSYLKLRKGRL